MVLPFGGNSRKMAVEVKGLAIVSRERSEAEIRMFAVDEIVERHLYDLAEQRGSLPGFCQALQGGEYVILGDDLFLCQKEAQVSSELAAVPPHKIEVSFPTTWFLART